MNRIKLLCLLLIFGASSAIAQQQMKLQDVEIINLGEERYYGHERNNKDKPLEGSVRLTKEEENEYIDCTFEKGIIEGTWNHYKNNHLKETLTYRNGYKDGVHIEYFDNSNQEKDITTYKKGEKTGRFSRYESDGTIIYSCLMMNGLRHGLEQKYAEGKIESEATFVHGKIEGKTFTNPKGNRNYRIDANYKNGLRDGKYTQKMKNGILLKSGEYAQGKRIGIWKTRSQYDRLKLIEEFVEGECIRKITYFDDEGVESDRQLADGAANGVTRTYLFNGDLKTEENYIKGRQVGKQKMLVSSYDGDYYEISYYNDNGQKDGEYTEIFKDINTVKTSGKYINGKKDGEWKYATRNGKVTKIDVFAKDTLKETKNILD